MALGHGDLADDVGGGTESVEAEPGGVAGRAQGSTADQPGAEQRRRLQVGIVPGAQLTVHRVEVGAADAAGVNLDQQAPGSWLGLRRLSQAPTPKSVQNRRINVLSPRRES